MKKQLLFVALLFCFSAIETLYGQCNIHTSTPTSCASEETILSVSNPEPGVNYEWDLDEDGTTDISGVEAIFTNPLFFEDSTIAVNLYADGILCGVQTIDVLAVPDPSIGVSSGFVIFDGKELRACNGSPTIEVNLFNASKTFAKNKQYTIHWGDGTPPDTYDNTTFSNVNTISHTYSRLGYFTIFVTVEHENGCVFTNNYTFYNGGNPSVGLVNPGNTVGLCAPATLNFPITNTENNPPGTNYYIFINGVGVDTFTQENVPDVFTYTFTENSCGLKTTTGNYTNAFDLKIVASNPCNSSTATIEPIEVTTPPTPDFDIASPINLCAGEEYTFTDLSRDIIEIISGNPTTCINVLSPNWKISGIANGDWVLNSGSLFGSDQIKVAFLKPGVFTIELTIISFSCGPVSISRDITVFQPPQISTTDSVEFILPPGNTAFCNPVDALMPDIATGDSLSYQWRVLPESGWEFIDGTDANSPRPKIRFTEGKSFTVEAAVSNPCATVYWQKEIAIPGPPVTTLLPSPDFCETGVLNFDSIQVKYDNNGTENLSVTWSFPGSNTPTSNLKFPENIRYDSPGSYIVTLTTTNTCGTTIVTDTFLVQEPSNIELPLDRQICLNEGPILLEAQPTGGTWTGNGVSGHTFYPDRAGSGRHTLIYQYGVGACFMEDQMVIDVVGISKVDVGPNISICENESPFSLNGIPAGGTWKGPDTIDLSTLQINPGILATGKYQFVYSLAETTGCTAKDTLSVEILPAPEVVVQDTSYCFTPGRVSLPVPSKRGGIWSGQGVADPKGFFDPTLAGGAGTYRLNYSFTAANGCTTNTKMRVGIVDPQSVDAGPDKTMCSSDEVYLLSDFATPGGGRWWSNSTSFVGDAFDPGEAGGGSHLLLYEVGTGNCRVLDSLRIEVIELKDAEAGPDQNACINEVSLMLLGNTPSRGIWKGPGIVDTQNGIFNPVLAGVGKHKIQFSIQDSATGCFSMDEKMVEVHPLPDADFQIPDKLCTGTSLKLISPVSEISFIRWKISDGRTFETLEAEASFEMEGIYTIALDIQNQFGCNQQAEKGLRVLAAPKAKFKLPQHEACVNLSILPVNESSGYNLSYDWDFGNSAKDTMRQPLMPLSFQTEFDDVTYYLKLKVKNECGADTYIDSVKIKALPHVNFGFSMDTACAPVNVTFNNISLGNIDQYFWDFGNGQTSNDSLPEIQPYFAAADPKDFLISLIGVNSCGADTLIKTLTIEPETVTSFFNSSKLAGCAPFNISLEDFSTPGTKVSWDFGDGTGSNEKNPIHTFFDAGNYLIKQVASNACASDSSQIAIEVKPGPSVDFDFSANLCEHQEIQFNNLSQNNSNSIWYFGNGDSTTINHPVYQFPNPGNFNVRLIGINAISGCKSEITKQIVIGEAPKPIFSLNNDAGCTPFTIRPENHSQPGAYYLWDFGDGNTSSAANPEHTYLESGRYNLQLTLTDKKGCVSDTIWTNIQSFPVPEANFEFELPYYCGTPVLVPFTNLSTGASGYEWIMEQDDRSSLTHPAHAFNRVGKHTILLSAYNQYGCMDTISKALQIIQNPVADFDLEKLAGCSPFTANFQNYSIGESFHWDFGDGNFSTERLPSHTYEMAGKFPVKLIVSNQNKCFDTLEYASQIDVWAQPIADFDWQEASSGEPNGRIQFFNESLDAIKFNWDFGDGNTSAEEDPLHHFKENGIREVYLQAIGERGCTDDTLVIIEPAFFGKLYVPNAFAPSLGKGEAQIFLPKGNGLKEYHLQIFSAYGELLWETFELINGQPAIGWDGTFNGAPLPQDVYVWKINAVFEDGTHWKGNKAISGKFQKVGSVTLLR